MLSEALPFTPPFIKPQRVVLLGVPLVLTAGAEFHRELLLDTATWRGVSLTARWTEKFGGEANKLGPDTHDW